MEKLVERFIKYVKVFTTSNEESGVTPSTPGQMVFAKQLRDEGRIAAVVRWPGVGVVDAEPDTGGEMLFGRLEAFESVVGGLRNAAPRHLVVRVHGGRCAVDRLVDDVPLRNPAPVEPETPDVDVEVTKPNFWTFKGDGFLQFLQNYVSGNWYKGGESNYSMLSSLTLEANYNNKSKLKWDNKLEMKLGFQTSRSDTVNKFKANEDLIRLTSKLGLQATKHWYYTIQLLAYTQFTRGLKPNDLRTYSDFMSPFNLNVGIGMDYKMEWFNKKLTGTVNISPLAVNYRYVDRTIFMNGENAQWFPSRHGVEADHHSLTDLGSQFIIDFTWKMAENISWKSRMYGFTSYKRVEYEWENTFSFQFNKYISSKLFIHPRFDDNRQRDDHHGYWMFKEYLSIGFNYSF